MSYTETMADKPTLSAVKRQVLSRLPIKRRCQWFAIERRARLINAIANRSFKNPQRIRTHSIINKLRKNFNSASKRRIVAAALGSLSNLALHHWKALIAEDPRADRGNAP